MKENALHIDIAQLTHFVETDNKALGKGIAEGDETAFAVLFKHYYPLLRPFVWKFTQSQADTDEILQETFIRVWLSRDKIPGIENLHGWIFTIASRVCLTVLRGNLNNRKKMTALQQRTVARVVETPADSTQLAEIARLVTRAVSQMPPQRQRIYRMSREEGLKPAVIADKLSLSVSTVKNVLVISLKEIREYLIAAGHFVSLLFIFQLFF